MEFLYSRTEGHLLDSGRHGEIMAARASILDSISNI